MGEFLSIVFGSFFGILGLYLIGCMVLAVVAPRRFQAYKAWNLRKAAERKMARAEKRRVRRLPVPLAAAVQSQARLGASKVVHHHHHHDYGDPLLHGLVAGAAASSLRDDIEEAIIRDAISDDSGEDRSGNW